MKKISLYIIALLLVASCDKVDKPHVIKQELSLSCDTNAFNFTAATQTKRNILLQEFTGHKCSNCPGGALKAKEIAENTNHQVIVVAIHPNVALAQPENNSDGSFNTNWITEEGDDYYNFQQSGIGLPEGSVNFQNSPLVGKDEWEIQANGYLGDVPVFDIKGQALWTESTRTVCVGTQINTLADVSGTYHILHFLVEDSIVDWQSNAVLAAGPLGPNENYVHNHVLRDVFGHIGVREGQADNTGNLWGETLFTVGAGIGDQFYSYSSLEGVPAEWNKDHLKVISFVFDMDTKEVYQVLEMEVEISTI